MYMIAMHFALIVTIISKVLLLLKIDIATFTCQQILSLSLAVVMKTQYWTVMLNMAERIQSVMLRLMLESFVKVN